MIKIILYIVVRGHSTTQNPGYIGHILWSGLSNFIDIFSYSTVQINLNIAKLDCSKKNDMISSMMNVWFRDEEMKKICQNLVESMPKRIREVIKNKEGHINY